MRLIGLNSNDKLCAHVSNHPSITTRNFLDAAKILSNLDPVKAFHDWDGTISYHLIHCELILSNNLSDIEFCARQQES